LPLDRHLPLFDVVKNESQTVSHLCASLPRNSYGLLNWAPTSANAAPERFAFLRSKEAKTLEGDL